MMWFSKKEPDLTRRFFCFGAVAAVIVPPPKKFFILSPPKVIIPVPAKPFDLPLQQMLELIKKLDEQKIEMSAIPRWVVCDQAWYDQVVANERPRNLDGPADRDGGAGPRSV